MHSRAAARQTAQPRHAAQHTRSRVMPPCVMPPNTRALAGDTWSSCGGSGCSGCGCLALLLRVRYSAALGERQARTMPSFVMRRLAPLMSRWRIFCLCR